MAKLKKEKHGKAKLKAKENTKANENAEPLEIKELSIEEAIASRRKKLAASGDLKALIFKIVFIVITAAVLLTYVFGITINVGEEMYPRMRDGDLVVYFRINSEFAIGDIVTFNIDGKQRFGRIVARGGDVVDMTDDGMLIVNGNVQEEEVFSETSKADRATQFPCQVEPSSIFVLCDNRTAATDSRDFGTIKKDDISGKVITILRRRGL